MKKNIKNCLFLTSLITLPTITYSICVLNQAISLNTKNVVDIKKQSLETVSFANARANAKINILEYIPTANSYYVNDFYNNTSQFSWLKNQLISKPEILYSDWRDDNSNILNDITINTTNDTSVSMYGDTPITRQEEKNINGRLYINVSRSYNNINGDKVNVTDVFILCGFKRTQPSIFANASTKSNGWMIYDSIVNNVQLRLENDSEADRMSFVLANVFYYDNYSDPIQCNFTNITASALLQNGYNISILKPYIGLGTSAMFLPPIMATSNNTEVQKEFGVVKFYKSSGNFIDNPINLIIVIGVSIVGLLIFILLIVKYFTRGSRIK